MRKLCQLLLVALLILPLLAACGSSTSDVEESAITTILSRQTTAVEPMPFVSHGGEVLFIQQIANGNIWSLWREDTGELSVRTLEVDVESRRVDATNVVLTLDFPSEYPIHGFSASNEVVSLFFLAGDLVPDPVDGEYSWYRDQIGVAQFGMDGRPRFDLNLDFGTTEPVDFHAAITDENGLLYVSWFLWTSHRGGVSVISETGDVLYTTSGFEMVQNLAFLDNTPIAIVHGGNHPQLREIDNESQGWGQVIDLADALDAEGRKCLNRILAVTENAIYFEGAFDAHGALLRYDLAEETLTPLLEKRHFSPQIFHAWVFIPLGEDTFLIKNRWDQEMFLVFPDDVMPGQETDERQVITLAIPRDDFSFALNGANFNVKVADFNRENPDYRIEVIEFAEADMPRLQAEIATGQVPDIIAYPGGMFGDLFFRNIPSHLLATRGFLADLYALIDADPDLDRADFLPNMLEAMTLDESLYELPLGLTFQIAAGSAAHFGTRLGWTVDEMVARLEELDFEGCVFGGSPRQMKFYIMLHVLIDDFIDWGSGMSRFDSPEFVRLLELVEQYIHPAGIFDDTQAYERIARGDQLLYWAIISRPTHLQIQDALFGGEAVLIGFPASEGVGHTFILDGSFAISSLSEHPEAAWSFVRQFFLPGVLEDMPWWRLSMIDSIEQVIEIDSQDEAGGGYAITTDSGWYVKYEPAREQDIARFREMVTSTTRVARLDRPVWDIVSEEAEVFFRGDRTAEETARIIQNRVQTFVHEQRR